MGGGCCSLLSWSQTWGYAHLHIPTFWLHSAVLCLMRLPATFSFFFFFPWIEWSACFSGDPDTWGPVLPGGVLLRGLGKEKYPLPSHCTIPTLSTRRPPVRSDLPGGCGRTGSGSRQDPRRRRVRSAGLLGAPSATRRPPPALPRPLLGSSEQAPAGPGLPDAQRQLLAREKFAPSPWGSAGTPTPPGTPQARRPRPSLTPALAPSTRPAPASPGTPQAQSPKLPEPKRAAGCRGFEFFFFPFLS